VLNISEQSIFSPPSKCQFGRMASGMDFEQFAALMNQKNMIGANEDAILKAARLGDLDKVRWCLNRRVSANCRDSKDMTPLHIAAEGGFDDMLILLLDRHADYEAVTKDGSALHYAVSFKRDRCILYLLEWGVDTQSRDKDLCVPLHLAAMRGQGSSVNLLLDFKADIEAKSMWGSTALHYAAQVDSCEIADILISRGANIEAVDNYLNTPLIKAAHFGRVKVLKFLVDRGANIDALDENGECSLHRAARKNMLPVVHALLQFGANPNVISIHGKSALDVAKQDDIRALLASAMAINYPTDGNSTAGSMPPIQE
jgi:ankyrin